MNLRRLWAIMQKEVRQMRRDRITLAMIMVLPIVQLVLFGYAINLNLRGLDAAIVDQAQTSDSRALVMDMLATDVIRPVATAHTPDQVIDLIRRGRINVGVVIPPDFEARKQDGRSVAQVLVDGSDATVAGAAAQLAQTPVDSRLPDAHAPYASTPAVPRIVVTSFYNPERRSAVNIVPGLVGVILTMTMVLFTAIAIVRERERGNIELLIATPLTSTELMLGKVVPYVLIGLVQTTVILALGRWLFDVPIRGSLLDVYFAALLLIASNLTLGLLISSRAQSQFQAMQMTFFIFLPSILLSGFMFPFSGMPKLAQWIAELLPLTHFLRLIRGIMLRNASLLDLWGDALALVAFIAVMMTGAILRFRKRLD